MPRNIDDLHQRVINRDGADHKDSDNKLYNHYRGPSHEHCANLYNQDRSKSFLLESRGRNPLNLLR